MIKRIFSFFSVFLLFASISFSAKSAEKIDAFRPYVASQTFGDPAEVEDEVDDEDIETTDGV